jgi:hypothetical protein
MFKLNREFGYNPQVWPLGLPAFLTLSQGPSDRVAMVLSALQGG